MTEHENHGTPAEATQRQSEEEADCVEGWSRFGRPETGDEWLGTRADGKHCREGKISYHNGM